MLPHFLACGTDVVLVYSVKNPADAAFLSEFDASTKTGGPEMSSHGATAERSAVTAVRPLGVPALRVICSATSAGGGSHTQRATVYPAEGAPHQSDGLSPGLTWWTGRVSTELLAVEVPDIDRRHVYLCGPGPFMESAAAMLEALGVPAESVHQEYFNF